MATLQETTISQNKYFNIRTIKVIRRSLPQPVVLDAQSDGQAALSRVYAGLAA
jgi:hypothetical protein